MHSHVVRKPGDPGSAVVHMFRCEGDKIAEMWDLGLSIPADAQTTAAGHRIDGLDVESAAELLRRLT